MPHGKLKTPITYVPPSLAYFTIPWCISSYLIYGLPLWLLTILVISKLVPYLLDNFHSPPNWNDWPIGKLTFIASPSTGCIYLNIAFKLPILSNCIGLRGAFWAIIISIISSWLNPPSDIIFSKAAASYWACVWSWHSATMLFCCLLYWCIATGMKLAPLMNFVKAEAIF